MLAGLYSRRRLAWTGVAAVALILFGFAPPAAAQSDEQAIGEDGPLVIVGVGGLKWPNISAETTPNIWALLEDPTTSASAVTVHTVGRPVCPTGGWLALSSGRPTPSPRLGSLCIEPYRTRPAGEGGHVVDWQQTKENLAQTSFEPRLGTLDAMLTEGDISTGAIGPGAALALADSNGWVAKYSRLMTKGSFDQDLTIVDAGTVFAEDLSGRSLRNVDAQIQRVIDAAPDNATILITSVSAPEGARVELGVALLRDPAAGTGHYLTSTATRWDGVTRLLDLPPTIAEVFDQPRPSDFGGAPLRLGSERPGAAETVDFLADISVKDVTLRGMSGRVSGLLEVVTFLVIVFLIWRP